MANAGLITFATEEGERGKKQQQKIREIRIRNKDFRKAKWDSGKSFRASLALQEIGL